MDCGSTVLGPVTTVHQATGTQIAPYLQCTVIKILLLPADGPQGPDPGYATLENPPSSTF